MFFLNDRPFPVGNDDRNARAVQGDTDADLDVAPRVRRDRHVALYRGHKEFVSVDRVGIVGVDAERDRCIGGEVGGVERPVHGAGHRVGGELWAIHPEAAAGLVVKTQGGVVVQPEVELFGVVDVLHPFDQDIDLVDGLEQVDVEAQRVALQDRRLDAVEENRVGTRLGEGDGGVAEVVCRYRGAMPYVCKRHNSILSIGNVGLHGSGIGQELFARQRRVPVLSSGLQVEEEQPHGLHLVHRVGFPVVVVVAQIYDGLALHIDVDVVVDLAAGKQADKQKSRYYVTDVSHFKYRCVVSFRRIAS